MSGSIFGKYFQVSTWGESHGKGIGAVVDGCPAGLPLSEETIQRYLNRRKPGQTRYSTPRKEEDRVEILSGIFEGMRIIPLMRSMAFGTIGGAAALPAGRPSEGWRQEPLPAKSCGRWRLK